MSEQSARPSVVDSLSVILPAFNAAPFLDAALAGVAAQSRRPDEVVVLDDASTDGTPDVVRRWEEMLPLRVVRRSENRGLGAARKLAIERSEGDVLALLDADDYWLPDHLAVMLECYERNGGIVTPNHYRWVPGAVTGSVPSSVSQPMPPPEQQARAILTGNFLSYGSVFSRRDYQHSGGFRELRRSEDWDLWIRMLRDVGCRVSRPNSVTLLYRKRPDSLSGLNGCIQADIAILMRLMNEVEESERATVARVLRRQRARSEFLQGLDDASAGDLSAARRRWVRAVVQDRSLRWGDGDRGSTALRAGLCLLAPRRALSLRDRRWGDSSLLVK